MVRGSRGTRFTGSALIRLLAQISGVDAPESKHAFAERLSHWLTWTDAISLSAALDGGPTKATGARPGTPRSASAEERECARVRATLTTAIAEDCACTADNPRPPTLPAPTLGDAMDKPADFSIYRRRYLSRQKAMETSIGPWRGRVRAALSDRSPAMARLAAVDAVMEQVLNPHERRLLSGVPMWLEQHFERLRQAHEETQADALEPADADLPVRPAAWLQTFCKDMHGVLLAELDTRLQPVEGLLQAVHDTGPLNQA